MDFSVEENRARMKQAIEEVGRKMGETYPLVIEGKKISTAKTIESVNPSHFIMVTNRKSAGQATTAGWRSALRDT